MAAVGQDASVVQKLETGADGRTEVISFAVGDAHYGVDIMAVREIKGWTDVCTCRGSQTTCAAC